VDHSRSETVTLPAPDYEADDVLVVTEVEQLRALGDELRTKLVLLLRERARSTSELAEELEMPRGTVGHHLKVLEKAGLIRVVRTRQVRAVTEKYYGRVARLFVVKSEEYPGAGRTFAAVGLRQAADELPPGDRERLTFGLLHVRLAPDDARRLTRRLERLADDFRDRETEGGDPYGFAFAMYPREAGP
jgi:DNA-binding transcriptional ArsR family regulator